MDSINIALDVTLPEIKEKLAGKKETKMEDTERADTGSEFEPVVVRCNHKKSSRKLRRFNGCRGIDASYSKNILFFVKVSTVSSDNSNV
jgi:hypothetical protein